MKASPGRNLAAAALALAAILFALFPLTRPWADQSGTVDGLIEATASQWWVPSHMFGAIGFLLLALGALAVREAARGTPGDRPGWFAAVATLLGTGLLLPFYGGESFGLHVIGASAQAGVVQNAQELIDGIRFDTIAVTTFALGLIGVAAGGILLAVAAIRARLAVPGAAILAAVGVASYLPQFFGPPWVRIAHGILLAIGLLWLAYCLRTSRARN